ncbi:MAG: RsiV family protein [Oscillospiraceae bacterium]
MKNEIKEAYDNIEIPTELDFVVNAAANYKVSRNNWIKYVASACAGMIFVFILLLNTSPVVAAAAQEIPVIGNICKVFTFVKYDFEDEVKKVDIKIPNIEIDGKSDLEKCVNLEVMRLINEEKADAEARAEEYYNAYLETGGKPSEYTPLEIVIDYEIKYMSEKDVSFKIYKYETLASGYATSHFFNIDIESGKLLTLRSLIGSDYQKKVADEIKKQISEMDYDSKRSLYFDDIDIENIISENTKFYIGEDGKSIVVVFDKYEIAAGAAGQPEFVISK